MGNDVIIHEMRYCGEWVDVEMGDNNWLKNISDVLITCEAALHGDQAQLAVV